MNPRHNLTHASLNTSLISEISNVLPGFANDDTSFLRRDNSTEGQRRLRVFLIGAGSLMFLTIMIVVNVQVLKGIIKQSVATSSSGITGIVV